MYYEDSYSENYSGWRSEGDSEDQSYFEEGERENNYEDSYSENYWRSEGDSEDQSYFEEGERENNTNWCSCGHCEVMKYESEAVCCKEIKEVCNVAGDLDCITLHTGFKAICLNVWVLQIAYYAYRQHYGNLQQDQMYRCYRYTAYRQFVRWCWRTLGKSIRVPIPSCVLCRIRTAFPIQPQPGFVYPSL